jgi:hypothetical protein
VGVTGKLNYKTSLLKYKYSLATKAWAFNPSVFALANPPPFDQREEPLDNTISYIDPGLK